MLQGGSLGPPKPKGGVAPKLPIPKASQGPVSRSQGVGKLVGIPKPFAGAPKLQGALKQAERPLSPGLQRMMAESKAHEPKGGTGGTSLPGATITLNPLHDLGVAGKAVQTGYKDLGNAVGGGVAKETGKLLGNTASNLINLPAQAIDTGYALGKTAVKSLAPPGTKAHTEAEQEQRELVKSFVHESAAAHLVKGEWREALRAAERNPVNTAMEAYGGASALDRVAGTAARTGALGSDLKAKTKLSEPVVPLPSISRQPKTLLAPGDEHASVALRPYDKGLVKRLVQGGKDSSERPRGLKLTQAYRKHYDQTEGSLLRINQNSRSDVINARMKAVKPGRKMVPGTDAISHFGWGTLSDPKVLNDKGTPVYRDQLSQLVEHHSKPVPGESVTQKDTREANMVHAQKLLEDPAFERNPHAAYDAAMKTAADKRALEPELIKHGIYTKDQMRQAKVIPAFQFHWRNEDPFVDIGAEDSPFTISDGNSTNQVYAELKAKAKAELKAKGGKAKAELKAKGGRKTLSTNQVYAELKAKGIDPDQLSFTTTKPFQNPNAAYNRTPAVPKRAGMKQARGSLTGAAFKNGQYDPTYDAVVRQHLTDQKLVDEARAVKYKNTQYTLTKEHLAELAEQGMGSLSAEDKAIVQGEIEKLREGSVYFDGKHSLSPGQEALEAKQLIEGLHPDVRLSPARIAHPYAPRAFRNAQLNEDITDRIDPAMFVDGRDASRYPSTPADLHNREAGEMGLVHKAIADAERKYENDTGSAMRNLITKPANWWRRANIAYSVRHVPGLAQEIGLRALVNKIGPQSYLRGRKLYAEAMKGEAAHPFEAQRLRGLTGGTVAQMTEDLNRKVTANQLWGTRAGKAVELLHAAEAHKVSGAPLRAARAAMDAYGKVTTSILHAQRKILERPQELAGLGKHWNDEAKRITGKSLPVIKQMQGVHSQLAKGVLDNKALDATARSLKEYWGDWQATSPAVKKAMVISPFFKWYTNSLKFLYHTLPAHHPIKTSMLVLAEDATAEQRKAEGQGYSKGLSLGPLQLAEGQQGSIPVGPNFRASQEYYTPSGAVSSGLEGALGAVFPYASDAWAILHGTNPLSGKTLENSEYKQITDSDQRILLALLSGLESFMPPVRIAKQLTEKGNPEKEDPWGKALGIPPSLWKVIRPLRTEKTRSQSGEPKPLPGRPKEAAF